MAKTIGSGAIRASASAGITRAPDTPTKRSAPSITSAGPPVRWSAFVCSAYQRLTGFLDREATGRGDVLEVDAAEARGHGGDRADDLVDVLRRQAERERVDAAELLEEHALALHDRHRRLRADVAEAEDGRAVGDHRDG